MSNGFATNEPWDVTVWRVVQMERILRQQRAEAEADRVSIRRRAPPVAGMPGHYAHPVRPRKR